MTKQQLIDLGLNPDLLEKNNEVLPTLAPAPVSPTADLETLLANYSKVTPAPQPKPENSIAKLMAQSEAPVINKTVMPQIRGPASDYEDLINQYKKLTETRSSDISKQMQVLDAERSSQGMNEAAARIAEGLNIGRGSNLKAKDLFSDTNVKNAQAKLNEIKSAGDIQVEDLLRQPKIKEQLSDLNDKESGRDPSSAKSIFYRELARKEGMPVNDNLSADDLEKMMPSQKDEASKAYMKYIMTHKTQEAKQKKDGGYGVFKNLPEDDKETIKKLAKSNADKTSISNSIDAVLNNWDQWDEKEQLQQGRQLIKVLNSTQGQDAVGSEEAKRLAGKLEFAMGNLTNDNPIQFGRDLKGFKQDAMNTSKSIRDSIGSNKQVIDKAYGRIPADQEQAPTTNKDLESKIQNFMIKNKIENKEEAIKILKENGKI